MPLRDDQKLEVQQRTDIVRLVGEHVALKSRGKEFLGLCPFHDDKNPSLHVSPAKQIYKCFSCGAGGDVFSFVQSYHKMTFPEALKFLAERAGVQLVDRRGPQELSQGPSNRQRILDANAGATNFFGALYRHAQHGQVARAYTQKRGISAEMLEAFQIGAAPDMWDGLVQMIRDKAWDRQAFELAGLISPRTNGEGHYDRLRHRLIFPICDSIGRVIAFGGRKLREEDEPKYLNSPETPVFNKSLTLFGLHLAKKAIGDTKTAVIVEGYTDVIACHQAGVRNVVATLGTALTPQHVAELRRYCERVVLVYDGDAAGIKATDRAIEVFLTGDLDVALAILPDELDPAEMFELPDGQERWQRAIGSATAALEYQFERVKSQFDAAETVTGRQKLVENYLQRLGQAGLAQMSPIRRSMVVQRVCSLLHLSEQTVQDLLKRLAPVARPAAIGLRQPSSTATSAAEMGNNPTLDVARPQNGNRIRAVSQAERYVIGCLIRDAGLFHLTLPSGRTFDEVMTPAEFVSAGNRELYEKVYRRLAGGESLTLGWLLADLATEDQQELANLATEAEYQVEQTTQGGPELAAEQLASAVDAILMHHREEEYQQVRQTLAADAETQSDAERARLTRQLLEHRRANPSPARIARLGS